MRPIYIQIKRKDLVVTKRGIRNRSDWHLIATMQYLDTQRLFTSLGGDPIETDIQFIQAIYEEFGEGIYSCVAGKKKRRGFWSFLLFEIKDDGTCYRFFRNNPFDKRRRNRRNSIINDLKELQSNSPLDDAAKIQEDIDDEIAGEQFDQMLNKIFIGGKRFGPFPYLKSVLRVGKFENLQPKHKRKIQGFFGDINEEEPVIDKEEFPPIEQQDFWSHGDAENE